MQPQHRPPSAQTSHRPVQDTPGRFYWSTACLTLAGLLSLTGCTLEPKETGTERAKLASVGQTYETPIEQRQLPELPARPGWRDVLQRAFLANGNLEAAYFQWKAAVQRVAVAGEYPNANLAPSFSYLFSGGQMKAWDRTTVSVGFDPTIMLQWPIKVKQAAKVALDEARAQGERFAAAKFDLQRKVLATWLDYALATEKARIQSRNIELLKMLMDTSAQRVAAGGPQQDMLKAQTAYELASNELGNLQTEAASLRAALNGLLGRQADAPLAAPNELPQPRVLLADDAQLLAMAVGKNPELAALAHEVAGRSDALELARMAYIPDFQPQISFTGGAQQVVGMMVNLPTTLRKIRGSIEEAQAMLRATQAAARQNRSERGADFVATLYSLRNNERQITLLQDTIAPQARQVVTSSMQAYATGSIPFADLVDSQRTLLDVQVLLAEVRIVREKRLAELEALAGVDVETLGSGTRAGVSATQPSTTTPATEPAATSQAGQSTGPVSTP